MEDQIHLLNTSPLLYLSPPACPRTEWRHHILWVVSSDHNQGVRGGTQEVEGGQVCVRSG